MIQKLLVANRGEIAIRIMRTATELGIRTVAIYSEDDAGALHVRRADEAVPLTGRGAGAYLDITQVVEAARVAGCEAVHPGYGFLSENAGFASACEEAGLVFVGPTVEQLTLLGDKLAARALAEREGVPTLAASTGELTEEGAVAFLNSLAPGSAMVIKAVGGGGGRGMRVVREPGEVRDALSRCRSEALAAFGNGALYCEEYLSAARHVEVQVVGDGRGSVVHLFERDCSVQRRHQKVVEVAPAPFLADGTRKALLVDAVRMARSIQYRSLGTFEFLVAADGSRYAFIEANPRLQVEHTVTEEVLGVDLVAAQLRLAAGGAIEGLGLAGLEPRGSAIQLRINAESIGSGGQVIPSAGRLTTVELPSGPGVRVDSAAFAGLETNQSFDSLLAKVICSSPDGFEAALARARRGLGEMRIEGVNTNAGMLRALLQHPAVSTWSLTTTFLEEHAGELAENDGGSPQGAPARSTVGASVDTVDPLAVLSYGKGEGGSTGSTGTPQLARMDYTPPDGLVAVVTPMQATVLSVDVVPGERILMGQQVAVVNSMKMEYVITAEAAGIVQQVVVSVGDTILEGQPLVLVEPAEDQAGLQVEAVEADPDHIRPDLADVRARHEGLLDASRPDAVARRRKTGQRTTRENLEQLCEGGEFNEYGGLVIAAQRQRRTLDDLIANTPADGMVVGIGQVNADKFGPDRSRTAILAYDYTVLAGTQGTQNHAKKDRMFALAERLRLPVVLFSEGGGGRPGDTDKSGVAGLDTMAFHLFGRLSGLVPLIGINSGRCFAGNAALLGCCDVVIATANSNIGMGGPAMVEGGGLGVFRPEEIGPMEAQVPNGVVDIAVADEVEAVAAAKQYLSYFQGDLADWACEDQRLLRSAIPENRLRVYDIRKVIGLIADTGSVLEIRPHFGLAMVTALARVEGRPVGIISNNPAHISGAIDSPAADKAARFMQLCDAFDIPIVFLCDTPGIMVGPEVEKTGLVRHASRLFVIGASITVPFMTFVLRKSYGLGAQAMAGGSHKAPIFSVSWPTGEFGGMGLEGAVKLGFRKELEAIEDPAERKRTFDEMVERSYARGKALNTATHFEIDDVIDPAETRQWIIAALNAAPPPAPRAGKKRPAIDTW